jgi:2-polyprenyl-3-methyl-5-hydroxy-6-metoxy-1,4-benzoquinol methylase
VTGSFLSSIRAILRSVVCPIGEIRSEIPSGSSVFDLGCGTGAVLSTLVKNRIVSRVGGCETSESLLQIAKLAVIKSSGSTTTLGDFVVALNPPDCIREYDCVLLIDVLHHIPKKVQLNYLRQLADKMRPGAFLILKDINAAKPCVWFNRLHDAMFSLNGFQEISVAFAAKHLSESGLSIQKTFEIHRLWYPHYFVIAQKPTLGIAS